MSDVADQRTEGTTRRKRRLQYLSDMPLAESARDVLDFSAYAEALAAIIDSRATGTPLSLAVSAPWGAGKTSLAKLVEAELEQRTLERKSERPNVTCWFNAWMHDDAPHLGAAMAAAVAAASSRRRPLWRKVVQPVPTSMLSPQGRWARRFGIAVAALAIIAALLSIRSVRESLTGAKVIKESGFGEAGSVAFIAVAGLFLLSRLLSMYDGVARFFSDPSAEAARGSMGQVRERLGRLISHGIRHGRLVVFIDDLERCRPERAIEVCEVAAQLLAHDGVVVVFIADMDLIARSAEKRYGSETLGPDAGRRFLEKIIQIQLTLPPARDDDIVRLLSKDPTGPAADEPLEEPSNADDGLREMLAVLFHAYLRPFTERPKWAPVFLLLFALTYIVAFRLLGQFLFLDSPPLFGLASDGQGDLEQLLGIPPGTGIVEIINVALVALTPALMPVAIVHTGLMYLSQRRARGVRAAIQADIETLDKKVPQDQLEQKVVDKHSRHEAVARGLVRAYLIDAAAELDGVEDVILKFPPTLPRGAKRMLNHARLLTQIARARQMFDADLTPEHLGEWIVINERWRAIARRVEAEPTVLGTLERSARKGADALAACLSELELPTDDLPALRRLLTQKPRLGDLTERLVHFQPAPGATPEPEPAPAGERFVRDDEEPALEPVADS